MTRSTKDLLYCVQTIVKFFNCTSFQALNVDSRVKNIQKSFEECKAFKTIEDDFVNIQKAFVKCEVEYSYNDRKFSPV